MELDRIAPWAEPALLTADQLLALPDGCWSYELIEGRLVRMTPAGWRHGQIPLLLGSALLEFVRQRNLGEVAGAETGFLLSRLGEPATVLAPDIAFVELRGEDILPGFSHPLSELFG